MTRSLRSILSDVKAQSDKRLAELSAVPKPKYSVAEGSASSLTFKSAEESNANEPISENFVHAQAAHSLLESYYKHLHAWAAHEALGNSTASDHHMALATECHNQAVALHKEHASTSADAVPDFDTYKKQARNQVHDEFQNKLL